MRLAFTIAGAIAVVAIVWWFGVRNGRPTAREAVSTRHNVLLISIDTLRADRLPAYGYERVDTPSITRLAREGVVFEWAFAPVPLTLPSHVSLMTGLEPFTHGVRDNGGFYVEEAVNTLAEILRGRGYRTGAFVSAFVLDSRWGLDQGFDQYFDDFQVSANDLAAMAAIQRPGQATWAEGRSWLEQSATQPFFLWLHLFDPHTPYTPPEPFKNRYAAAPYDGEIASADAIVGDVLADLDRLGKLDDTLVVLVSDHGEGLGEHDEDEHGLLAYDSTLRVPWIMRLPGGRFAGTTVNHAASLTDVMPTMLDLLGMTKPHGLDGTSMLGSITGPSSSAGRPIYAETHYPRIRFDWSELTVLRDERFKYVRAPRPELYEYRVDLAESRNLVVQHRDIAMRFERVLEQLRGRKPLATAKPTSTDPEVERRLLALGYVGGASRSAERALADPKDKVRSYQKLMRARQALEEGRTSDGIDALEALLVAEPDLEPAHRVLRDYWISVGQHERGLSTFSAALDRRPGDALLLQDLAILLRAARRPGEALAKARQAVDADSGDVRALVLAADILNDQGQYADALALLTRARGLTASSELSMKLAQAHFRLGRVDEAERILADALATYMDVAGAHYLLAQIFEQRGDFGRAESEYRREIDTHVWDYQARFNLAMLLGRRGSFGEQAAMLDRIPPLAPAFHEVHFYRAKAYLDSGNPAVWPAAIEAAERGLQLAPQSPTAPLGHYVLADVYRLQGKNEESARELARGQALERRLAPQPGRKDLSSSRPGSR
jgi:arylsulfatase A-like enzyme/predicted Zn-dependent protease